MSTAYGPQRPRHTGAEPPSGPPPAPPPAGAAADFLKRFRWTTEDQNEVSLMIAEQKLSPREAAERWVDSHESTWRTWLS